MGLKKLRNKKGATTIEFIIITILMLAIAVVIISLLYSPLKEMWKNVFNSVLAFFGIKESNEPSEAPKPEPPPIPPPRPGVAWGNWHGGCHGGSRRWTENGMFWDINYNGQRTTTFWPRGSRIDPNYGRAIWTTRNPSTGEEYYWRFNKRTNEWEQVPRPW
ncbi:MAG: hypothetical protein AB1410_11010 [Acidobacteriota bacterium]